MPAPKEKGKVPVARTIKFVKRANQWVYGVHYNEPNVVDSQKFFATEAEALEEYKKDILAAQNETL